jgi:hypothetical protein
MRASRLVLVALLVTVPLAFAACKREEAAKPPPPPAAAPVPPPKPEVAAPKPFSVTSVDLGNAIGTDKRVSLPKTTFAPTDTIYASAATDGQSPSVTLTARWTYGADGQLVKEDSLSIAPTGPVVNEFHISKPDGWPVGQYKVEISANGVPAASKSFEVVTP